MITTLSLSAYSELPPDLADADPAQQIWLPLDMLVAESPSLAKWRGLAVDGRVIPSYVFIGPRGGSVPIRLALLGGIQSEDLLSTNAIVKLLVELDLAPLLAQDFALFGYPVANPHRTSHQTFGRVCLTRLFDISSRSSPRTNWTGSSLSRGMSRFPASRFRFQVE